MKFKLTPLSATVALACFAAAFVGHLTGAFDSKVQVDFLYAGLSAIGVVLHPRIK